MSRRCLRTATVLAAVILAATAGVADAARPPGSLMSFGDASKLPLESELRKLLPVAQLGCQQGLNLPGLSIMPSPAGWGSATTPPDLPPGVKLPPGMKLPGTKKKTRPVSFRVAMRRVRALAGNGAAGRVMRKLRNGIGDEGDARGLAIAAGMGGSPRLVLGSLLAASAQDPRDAMNLVNLAVPLITLGKPAEALAVLDRADALARKAKKSGRTSAAASHGLAKVLGIPGSAVLKNNRGAALLKLGRFADAERSLRAAAAGGRRALSEAQSNLGLALLCQGKTDAALKAIRASYARQAHTYLEPKSAATGGVSIGFFEIPLAEEVYDLSAGTDGVLPPYKWPSSPAQSAAMHPELSAVNTAHSDRLGALTDRSRELDPLIHAVGGSNATKQRRFNLLAAVNETNFEPALDALNSQVLQAFQDVGNYTDKFWAGTYPAIITECAGAGDECLKSRCQAELAAAHGGFEGRMATLDRLAREYWKAAGRRESGITAMVSDPLWNEAALVDMRLHAEILFGLVTAAPLGWVGAVKFNEAICVPALEPPPAPGEPPAPPATPGACPEELKDLSGSFKNTVDIPSKHGEKGGPKVDVSVKVSCSSAEVELSQGVKGTGDLLSVFGKGKQDFKRDEQTFVIGVKGSVPGGIAQGQSGIGIVMGPNGLKDIVWRVGAKGESNPFGPLKSGAAPVARVWGGEEDISLIAGVKYMPTLFGFQ